MPEITLASKAPAQSARLGCLMLPVPKGLASRLKAWARDQRPSAQTPAGGPAPRSEDYRGSDPGGGDYIDADFDDAPPVAPSVDGAALGALRAAIACAKSLDDLRGVAARAKDAPPSVRDAIREDYASRQRALSAAGGAA